MADPVELPAKFAELLERGIELVNRGDADGALDALNQVIDHTPTCAKALCGRGTALRIKGEPRAAVADYNAAIGLDSDYARAYFNRGLAWHELGEQAQAFADFDRAIALHPEAGFYFHRGRCRSQLQDFENAITDFTVCLRLDPAVTATLLDRGIAYSQIGKSELAIQDLEASVRHMPHQTAAYSWFAHELLKLGDVDRAAGVLDSALKIESDDCTLRWQRAQALYGAKEFEAAICDYNHVVRIRPADADAYYSRGCAWSELNESDDAIADHTAAIRLRPDFAQAFWARGNAWLSLGEPVLAFDDLTNAIAIAPSEAGPFVRRAEALGQVNDDENAMADLNRALQLDPHNQSALQSRCQLNAELGNWQLAEIDLDTLSVLQQGNPAMPERKKRISMLLAEHFEPQPLSDLTITDRQFPYRVRADLQRAIDRLFGKDAHIAHFCGVKKQHEYNGTSFADLLYSNPHDPAIATPPEYEELDIGEDEPIRCLKNGLWLVVDNDQKFAVFLTPAQRYQHIVGMRFNVAAPNNVQGAAWTQSFFKHLEESVLNSESYRGKILSLEVGEEYSGMSSGIRVHKLRTVERDQVVLPQSTLDLLDRNIIQFAAQRKRLAGLGLATKKGVLFYGPPGTGKTHTIHYLARAMAGHTTLLITAEQVGLLSDYMTLARLLQPSIVVIEDADLIARERSSMGSACEELLLNKLLNEMDGLRPETDVFFILTTNRPEALEAALASRPGRIDQAIEFPLPDAEGRRKLVKLYSRGATLPENVVDSTVNRTEGVSASFVKELVRRAAQFYLERPNAAEISDEDVANALNEMLFAGGSLNRSLLGVAKENQT